MSLFGSASKPASPPDVEVQNIASDSISCLAWSPAADLLAVGSWSNEVRIFEVGPNGMNQGKAMYSHEGPVLCLCWSKDGSKVISGGADKAARMFDLQTQQTTQIGAHDAPVSCIAPVEVSGQSLILTGSWDKTLKYWNIQTPSATPIATVPLPERCYALDVATGGGLLVVGTAERHIVIYNLANPTQAFKTLLSPLRMQTRTIACFADGTGYTIGSIEGRVAVQHVADTQTASNYSFKCHRKDAPKTGFGKTTTDVYAVNATVFHPLGTLASAGGDGVINIWDLQARTRVKMFSDLGGTITSVAFSMSGQFLAYSLSYDWSQGYAGNKQGLPNKVMIHVCQEDEVKKRPPKK